MKLDYPFISHGIVDIGPLVRALETVKEEDWAADRAYFARITSGRAGSSLILMTNTDFSALDRWRREMRDGNLSVYKRPIWSKLGSAVQKLLDGPIARAYPGASAARIQLALLPPGAVIDIHSDGRILEHLHRLHIPIVTNPHVVFQAGQQVFHMPEGHLFELDNVIPHGVVNGGEFDRLHLLIDLVPHNLANVSYFESLEELSAQVS